MNNDRATDRMQAVLDGVATRAETGDLQALLARDATAAGEFASWRALFDGLSNVPSVHPPEGLVASIRAAVERAPLDGSGPSTGICHTDDQHSDRLPVLVAGSTQTTRRPFGFKTVSSWLMPAPIKESHMNTQQKYLAGGAALVVAIGVAAMLSSYPPKSNDVVGTVVPAERYRAPQSGAEAVKLGQQGTSQTAATTSGESVPAASSTEAAAQANRIDANAQADRMVKSQADSVAADRQGKSRVDSVDAERMGKNRVDSVDAERQGKSRADSVDADRMVKSQADQADAQVRADHLAKSQADQTDSQMKADHLMQSQADHYAQIKADHLAQSQADHNVQMKADKVDAQMQADHASVQRQANQADAAARADLSAAQKQADHAASAQAQADKAGAAARAELAAAQKQADHAAALQMQADKADAAARADRSGK